MQFSNACILIFARPPVRGKVKTRLAEKLGADTALRVYRQLLKRTLNSLSHAPLCPLYCYLADTVSDDFFLPWEDKMQFRAQSGTDLGHRMFQAMTEQSAVYDYIVLVGSDCPGLQPRHLEQALSALQAGCQAAISPAEDGGYVLLALRQPRMEVFSNIQWSGATVFSQTVERFKSLGWRWRELDMLWDVDRPEDYQRWCDEYHQA